jgi:hypothetical protein
MFEEGINEDMTRVAKSKRKGAQALEISDEAEFEETSNIGSDEH